MLSKSEINLFMPKSHSERQQGGPLTLILGAAHPWPLWSVPHLLPPWSSAQPSPTDMTLWLGLGPLSSPWPSQGTIRQRLILNTASRHDPASGFLLASQLAFPGGLACHYCSQNSLSFPPTALKIIPFLAITQVLHICFPLLPCSCLQLWWPQSL